MIHILVVVCMLEQIRVDVWPAGISGFWVKGAVTQHILTSVLQGDSCAVLKKKKDNNQANEVVQAGEKSFIISCLYSSETNSSACKPRIRPDLICLMIKI